MARMLTEEEVERLEKQRELQGRAQAATDPNALYNQRMAAAHAAAMERRRGYIELNPNAETDTKLRHQVLRENELAAAQGRELEKMGTMDVTREREAELKMLGMRDQGMGAARLNAEAAKHESDNRFRAAELEWGARERMGTADNATKFKLGEMEGKWRKDTNDANVEIAGLQADATVQAAREKATAEFARDLMQQRQLDQKTALQYAQGRSQRALKMVNDSKNKNTGKARLTYEEALKRIDEEDKVTGNLPGRALQEFVKR